MGFLKENSVSYEILMNLKDVGSDFAYFTFIHPPRSLRDGLYHMDRRINERTRAKEVSRLKKRGLLVEYKKGGEHYLKITQKGQVEVMRYGLKKKSLQSWDGKWRIIIFDIPEATRGDRNFLRKQLKWLGFLELQKSVWVFPYEIKKDLQNFISLCKIELNGDIRFMVVDEIEDDADVRLYFELK